MTVLTNMYLHMRTSIDIPDPLLKKARRLARKRKTTLRGIFLEGLTRVVEEDRARTLAYSVPDESFGEGGLVDGITPGDWDLIRAIAYEGRGG